MWNVGRSVILLALAGSMLGASPVEKPELDGYERFVQGDGGLRFSPDVTRELVHLGSWFVPSGDSAGFHHVYTQPEAIAVYRETGSFPDGAALVKEIVSYRRGSYTTGVDVASATGTVQWFLMVKDSRGRFADSPLWGEGWGWGLFKSDDPGRNAATDFRTDCLGCHVPARSTDWVYVTGYPSLHAK